MLLKYQLGRLDPIHSFYFNISGPSETIIQDIRVENCTLQPFYVRQNHATAYYEYDREKKKLYERASEILFNREGVYSTTAYPAYVADVLGTGEPILILRRVQGVGFYRYSRKSLQRFELLAQDSRFHDIYRWSQVNHTVKFGHFYSDKNAISMLTHSSQEGIKFYVVSKKYVKRNHSIPLWSVGIRNPEIIQKSIWHDPVTDFFITDTRRRDQDDIVLRTREGLSLYEFKSDYSLYNFLKTSVGAKVDNATQEDSLLFTDLTHQIYQDILVWNDHGLFVYQYQSNNNSYVLLSHSTIFSKNRGWKEEHFGSLQSFDLDGDQRDELILTGPQGITFLAFDSIRNEWHSVLDSSQFIGTERYARVLKVLPPCSSTSSNPILLTQDQASLQLFEVMKVNEFGEKKHNAEISEDNEEVSTVEPSIPRFTLPIRSNVTVPQQLSLANLTKKRFLRLAEKLDYSSLLQAVNTIVGQVQFTLPLAVMPTPSGLTVPLAIAYNNQQTEASLLGKGWSLTQPEFITVETSGSVYREDHRYYLFIEGSLQPLKPVNSSDNNWIFGLKNQPDVKITYKANQEKWRIETTEETLFFGKTLNSLASTAVQWGLTCKNWRGNAHAVSQQQPVPLAWYLNERRIKKNNQALYYHYEIVNATIPGGKSFTEYVYFKKITDRKDTHIVFDYALKTANEYNNPPLTDAEGIIQTTPRQRYYLRGYQVKTRNIEQTIQFGYMTDLNQRYLTSIEQAFGTQHEKVLQFSYEKAVNDGVLTSSILPNGVTIKFSYQQVAIPPLLGSPLSYPVDQLPSMMSGPDYTIIAFLSEGNYLMLRVLNSEATETYVASSWDAASPLAPLGRKGIRHYQIVPQQDFFSVELDYGTERDLYLFHRYDSKWSWIPTTYAFNKGALIRVGQDFVVIAELNQSALTLLELQNTEGKWKKCSLRAPISTAKPPKRLAVYGRFIVVYDDTLLWMSYRKKHTWYSQSLRELSNWASGCEDTLRKLDLDNKSHADILSMLNWQGLQIQSNFVLLSTLQEKNNQLFSKIHLLLLNNQYQIAQEARYEIPQENLLELIGNLTTPDGQIFKLGYQVDNNQYTIKFIDSLAYKGGKSLDDIRKDNSEPKINQLWQECLVESLQRTDEKRPRGTEYCSADPKCCDEKIKRKILSETETSFKQNSQEKISLINWARHQISLTEQGANCGNQEIIFTGSDWKLKPISEEKLQGNYFSKRLSNSFLLEKAGTSDSFKLYRQTEEGIKQSVPLIDLMTTEAEKIVLRYPHYLAYETNQGLVKFIEFSDHKTIGQCLEFPGEHIYVGSPYHALVTYPKSVRIGSTPDKGIELVLPNVRKPTPLPVLESFLIRPLFSLFGNTLKQTVNRLTLSAEERQRVITYDYANSFNRTVNATPFYQKVIVIPGTNKTESGWREEICVYDTSIHQFIRHETLFDSQGKKIPGTLKTNTTSLANAAKNISKESDSSTEDQKQQKNILLDNTGQRIIADLSPSLLEDEEAGYYGFESYEMNQIGEISLDSTFLEKTWQFNKNDIVKQGFAFTGENYLQLDAKKESNDTSLEGIFQPRHQDTTYLASCWLRCSQLLELNQAVPFLKGIVFTSKGEEVLGVLSRVKFQSGGWSYLELLIDLPFIKAIHQELVTQATISNVTENSNAIASPLENTSNTPLANETDVTLTVVLRVGAATNISVDLDHIRFSPLDSAFPVSVYHPVTGQATATIHANGLVTRTLYNSLQQPIAKLKEQGQLEFVSTESKTGHLFPLPEGIEKTQPPNRVTLYPESGFYEEFDTFALRSRWIAHEPETWKITPGQLHHQATSWNQIEADSRLLDTASVALRCEVSFLVSPASLRWHWQGGYVELARQGTSSILSCSFDTKQIKALPVQGEWILLVEKTRLWVWSEGVLLFDQTWSDDDVQSLKPWTRLMLEAQGNVIIKDFCLMNNPSVQIEYFNRFGDKTQVVTLKDIQTAQVSETLYDNLGRPAITSKITSLTRASNQSLLAYYPNFVTNDNPLHPNSVWKTGYLAGEVDRLNLRDHGFSYQRVVYASNPLNEEQAIGLAGPDFSVVGPYAKRFSKQANIDFLTNLFPHNQGYRQQVEIQPNGRRQVEVFDKNSNRVALYQHVPGYDHQLSTYEYEENNRLLKILPPLYHEKVHTCFKTEPLKTGEEHLSEQEKYWQQLGTHFIYHKNGHLLSKRTPDSGMVTFTYTLDDKIRFMAFGTNQTEKVVYLDYNEYGQLHRTGYLDPPRNPSELLNYVNSSAELPGTRNYQRFYYVVDHVEPILRNRIKRLVTFNGEKPFLEELIFNADHQVEVKGILSMLAAIEKQYMAGRLHILSYPITIDEQPFKLTYRYNKQGQLLALGTHDNPSYYAKFDYHPSGQLLSEQHQPDSVQHSFVRHYYYSSPGFIEKITDPFLTEDLTYTEGGYGQAGYGDQMVMQTAFNASWFKNINPRSFVIDDKAFADDQWVTPEISTRCVQALIDEGYLDRMKRPIKLYYPKEFNILPLFCSDGAVGYQIAQTLAERYFPTYGYRYAYGNYQELTKGKYFVGDPKKILGPLQPSTFSDEIPGLTRTQSKTIWDALNQAEYLNQGKRHGDIGAIYGKPDRSFFREEALRNELRELENKHAEIYTLYTLPIKKLLMTRLGDRRELTYEEFQAIFLKWKGVGTYSNSYDDIQKAKTDAQHIWDVLRNKLYLQGAPFYALSSLETRFKEALRDYATFIPDIVRILSRHFAHVLGETAFDIESYDIDANGNHRHFYTGFDRYGLSYRNGTNQIHTIKIDLITTLKPEKTFPMHHDAQGNVIQALHRGIQQIDYDPTSQRTTRILLTDGRSLKFSYDAKGERVLKRVSSAEGEVSKETYYIRDERGQVLVDYQVTYAEQKLFEAIMTVYLYGPRGLLGFIRNNAYYSVITDHEGSIRLIVKDKQVEAAYDYLPYGQLMRSYGNNPDAHITYRYTGQEWDEEIGLYNYHARLYDPSIGRFYQIDPKEQYFSPYKYAGNSPVSLVDPDGELAVTTAILIGVSIATALGSAYLGGAATNNNRWNPSDWDWKHKSTYAGIGIGGVVGAVTPIGFVASAGAIGVVPTVLLGTGSSYISVAASNHNWNPAKWEWKKPHTWNAAFQGFSAGSSIAGGIGGVKNLYTSLSSIGSKRLFIGSASISGVGLAYGSGVLANQGNTAFWDWNWQDPVTWEAILGGGLGGAMLPAAALKSGQFLKGNLEKIGKHVGTFGKAMKALTRVLKGNSNNLLNDLSSIGKNMYAVNLLQILRASGRIASGIGIAGGMTYLQVPGSWGEFDVTNFASYQVILNGLLSIDTLDIGGKSRKTKSNSKKKLRCKRTTVSCSSYTEAERKMQEAVSTAVHEVQKYLNDLKEKNPNDKKNHLHTTAVAVMTDDLIVVGFSGLEKSKGALFYFSTHDKELIGRQFADENKIGYPAKFHGDSIENTKLIQPIVEMKQNTQNLIDKLIKIGLTSIESNQIVKAYQKARSEYSDSMLKYARKEKYYEADKRKYEEGKSRYEKDIKENRQFNLEARFNNLEKTRKQLEKTRTSLSLDKVLLEIKNPSIPKILRKAIPNSIADSFWDNKKIKELKEEIAYTLKDKDKEINTKKLNKEVSDIINEFKKENKKPEFLRKSILNDEIDNSLWKNLPEAGKTCPWLVQNCGEPHAITGLLNRINILSSPSPEQPGPILLAQEIRSNYQNIRFMTAYDTKKLNNDAFKMKERCEQCKVTTNYIKHVPTDDDGWEIILNEQLNNEFFPDNPIRSKRSLQSDSTENKTYLIENVAVEVEMATSGATRPGSYFNSVKLDLVQLRKHVLQIAEMFFSYNFPDLTSKKPPAFKRIYDPNQGAVTLTKPNVASDNDRNTASIDYCLLGVQYGQEYRNGFTCHTDNMRMLVFLKDSHAKLETPDDTYSKQSCHPVEFNGRPSVYCEGKKTNVVYTTEISKNTLDQINDQLMLLQIVLHEGKKLYSWFQNLFSEKNNKYQLLKETFTATLITDEQKTSWKRTLDTIEKRLTDLCNLDIGKTDLRWVGYILEDRKEDFKNLIQCSQVSGEEVNNFTENLQALEIELGVVTNLVSVASEYDKKDFFQKVVAISDSLNSGPINTPILSNSKDKKNSPAPWVKQGFFKVIHQPTSIFISVHTTNNSMSLSGKQGTA